MAEKRGQYQYHDDGTTSQLVSGDISIKESAAIVPVDLQARLASTIQTHNAVSVPLSTSSTSTSWIDTDGFCDVSVTLMNDANATNQVNILYSHDGITTQGEEVILANAARQRGKASVKLGARYIKIWINNTDASVAHIMSAWVYLQS
jgi:hypothetical protein